MEVLADRYITTATALRSESVARLNPEEAAVRAVFGRIIRDPNDSRGDYLSDRLWTELERDPEHPLLINFLRAIVTRGKEVPERLDALTRQRILQLAQHQPGAVFVVVGSSGSDSMREVLVPLVSERLLGAQADFHDTRREVGLLIGLGPPGHAEVDRLQREGLLMERTWTWIQFTRGEWRPPPGGGG